MELFIESGNLYMWILSVVLFGLWFLDEYGFVLKNEIEILFNFSLLESNFFLLFLFLILIKEGMVV